MDNTIISENTFLSPTGISRGQFGNYKYCAYNSGSPDTLK